MSAQEPLIAWMQKIDERLQRLHDKLDGKADAARVDRLEERTRHLEAKQVGVAGITTSLGLWVESFLE